MRLLCRSLPNGAGKRLLLLLLLTPLYALAQSQLYTGTVKDSTGRGLARFRYLYWEKVLLLLPTRKGSFTIPAKAGDKLVFSGDYRKSCSC